MGEDSPGEVIFSHDSHVDYDAVNCAACHRNTFRLLKGGSLLNGELTYDEIHSGEACFSCHDGEAAFSVEEDCSYCHME
jgi:c(7)-type cytochrome triheme protein